jgi:hypothetical protein
MWGCDAEQATVPAEIDGDDGKVIEFGHCPLRFIGRSVADFVERFEDIERFPHTAKPYDERGERWHAFERYYRGKLAGIEQAMRRRKGGKGA